jgi:uncharacterized protein
MPTTATFTHGKFVWFEHMSPDVDKAQAFYNALFGWNTMSVPMGEQSYPMIQNQAQVVGGYRKAAGAAPTHWICFVSVPDVDASFNTIKAMGRRTQQSPTDYGPGRIAAATDPTGASFAMWKGVEGDRPDAPTAVGDWHWTELWTSDVPQALAFYQSVFGYGVDNMGPDYHLLTMDGKARAGVRPGSDAKGKSMWLPYVAVADCRSTVAKAVSLGATVMEQPVDTPGVGQYAVLIDPFGAPIGVIKVAPQARGA